ncbi:MAG: TonB family protein, partial [Elusimicrobia bacterium]|nr:TonB family protein [Elusimicrobiota bacterium]
EARAAVPKPPPLSTFDFLKMALPTQAHSAAPAQLSVKIPEHKIALADAPKLEDSAKKDLAPKLKALDLSEHPIESAKLDVKVSRRQAASTLAALPRLEDVGRKRVKDLPQALELEDRRREAVAAAGIPDMAIKATSRRQALAAVSALQEAAPAGGAAEPRKGLASLLPDKPLLMEAHPQAMMAPKLEKVAAVAPRLERRQAAQADASKKGVEIEGPLADRRVEAYSVPPFPDWAKNQGILEADVSIRFTVDEDGAVMPGMRVEKSSGYGRIDKLAMESLKSWRFASKAGAGVQWGVITFRFILE